MCPRIHACSWGIEPGALHLLDGLAEDVFVLVLGDVSLLVEGLDGQFDLLHGSFLHVQLLHVLEDRRT